MAKIILASKKTNGKTAIRLEKDLLKDLKDAASKTEFKNLSLQALADIAIRKFINAIETPKVEAN